MSESLEDKLARIAEEAEAGEADQTIRPIPAHIKVTRGKPCDCQDENCDKQHPGNAYPALGEVAP